MSYKYRSRVPTSLSSQEMIEYRQPAVLVFICKMLLLMETEGVCVRKFFQKYFVYLSCRCLYDWPGCTAINVLWEPEEVYSLLYLFPSSS